MKPVSLPSGVEVGVKGEEVAVKGPKGALTVSFDTSMLSVSVEDASVQVKRQSEEKAVRARHGLVRSLIANAVTGVSDGFSKRLDLFGVGYRAEVQGSRLTLHVGYSHPVVFEAPKGVELSLENGEGGAQARIVVSGIDKQQVGQAAADIRAKRKPEPYKGKGIRYVDEIIHWKAGKAAVG